MLQDGPLSKFDRPYLCILLRNNLVKQSMCRLCRSQSPGVVSLSRIRKEPSVFPGARRSLMASFLEMFLKNHLQHKYTTCFVL